MVAISIFQTKERTLKEKEAIKLLQAEQLEVAERRSREKAFCKAKFDLERERLDIEREKIEHELGIRLTTPRVLFDPNSVAAPAQPDSQ